MAYTITKELSDRVVGIVHGITGGDVNIMTGEGRIISSADPARVGSIHEGGARIMKKEVGEIAITPAMAKEIQGAKAGYNGGIYYKKQLIGCIGIGGDPELVKPLQKMAAVIVEENIAREEQRKAEEKLRSEAVSRINNIAETMTVLSLNGSIQAAKIGRDGNGFKVVANQMRTLAESINEAVDFFKLD